MFRRLSVVLLLALVAAAAAHAASPSDAELTRQLDALLAPVCAPDKPGLTILVARDGRPVYRRAFGLANVEKKTPMRPENALRIASVTKQFTAAVILQLVDQKKIALTDDITKYLPEMPRQQTPITIEHLLTHTSGLFDYTSSPEWMQHLTEPVTHAQIIGYMTSRPPAFAPGEKWAYCNGGYYLLGVIAERVTHRSYEQCLQDAIFRPLGMTHSGYGKDVPSFPNEAQGYTANGDSVRPALRISMTSPFAAGAIVSTVDDLLRWDNAISAGRVMSDTLRTRAFTSYTLSDGTKCGYGYGWLIGELLGHRVEQHNGGINGFGSQVMRLPDDHAYIAMLANTDNLPANGDILAQKIGAVVLGQPLPEKGRFTMTHDQLDRFIGVYMYDSTTTRTITREGDTMYSQRSGGSKLEIFPTSDSTFAFEGRLATLTFAFDARGAASLCTIRQSGITQTFRKTAAPLPAARAVVPLTDEQLDACVGEYELAPTFHITITRSGTQLNAQATGQPAFEIFPESPTKFFLTVVDAQMEFTPGADGRMASLTLHQGGQHIPGRRVR